MNIKLSEEPTAFAVICNAFCGKLFLTEREYMRQMSRPDDKWCCPICGEDAEFDDENFEEFYD